MTPNYLAVLWHLCAPVSNYVNLFGGQEVICRHNRPHNRIEYCCTALPYVADMQLYCISHQQSRPHTLHPLRTLPAHTSSTPTLRLTHTLCAYRACEFLHLWTHEFLALRM